MKGISIIICTYNGAGRLPETLFAISAMEFTGNWEVIVVDNASTDQTSSLVSEFFYSNSTIQGRLLFESNQGLASARRTGWRAAKYPIVLFCDDDNWLDPCYLTIAFRLFEKNPKLGILGGCGSPITIGDFPAWFSEFSHSYAVGSNSKVSGKQKNGSAHYGAGCFFRKSALEAIDEWEFQMVLSDRKGKELVSGGDVELCFLVQLLGYELWFEEKLRFQHFIPQSRLNWPYYLRLKQGIASSFPLLNAYKVLFEGHPTIESLQHLNKHQLWISIKGILLCYFRSIFKPSLRNEVQLIESKTKVASFFKNHKAALEHLTYLMTKLN